jgi:di/tricarboxylate transporter
LSAYSLSTITIDRGNNNKLTMTFLDTDLTVVESTFCPCNSTVATTFDDTANWTDSLSDYESSSNLMARFLADDKKVEKVPWEIAVVTITIAIMFYFMISDKIYPDWVMLGGLMIFTITQIISIKECLAGFANEGILTVLALFVVADGLSRTGALDYYMGKILGRPKTIAGAQIRLMVPIACISAFFNNTPIVAIMIPVVLRWSKLIGCPKQQLLIPLSYATILGGTCTLVGTSTNLVLNGLLQAKYPNEPAGNIQLFDVGVYGVPNAIIGVTYMLCFGSLILPGGRNKISGGDISLTTGEYDDLLIGARVLSYSPAAGRTVKRSGLNNSAGIYLVNVRRATTGNIHRAVSPDFVVSVGDELFFTGDVEEFSAFCEAHGLEILTPDNIDKNNVSAPTSNTIGTKVDDSERLQLLNRISDQIDGSVPVEPGPRPTQVIVTRDAYHTDLVILVAVDCADQPGLLADISDALFQRAHLQIKHTEANVVEGRSLSVWRCETITSAEDIDVDNDQGESSTMDMVWTTVSQVLPDVAGTDHKSGSTSSSLVKSSIVQVVRAIVTSNSALVGKKPIEFNIGVASLYKAALVAYQKSNGKNAGLDTPFEYGDTLVLAVKDTSPLLQVPPEGFYRVRKPSKKSTANERDVEQDVEQDAGTKEVWTNLRVLFNTDSANGVSTDTTKGEFLTAFTIPNNSPLNNKTLAELGYNKLPGVVLVSCERPVVEKGKGTSSFTPMLPDVDPLKVGDVLWFSGSAKSIAELQRINGLAFYQESATSELQDRRIVQAVVARASPLVGRTVIDVDFRTVYGGAVLAIQRGSERVHEHPGFVKLQTGDVLLIEADTSFVKNNSRNYKTFALVSEVEDSAPPRPKMFFVCLAMILTAFAVSAIEDLDQSLFVLTALVGIIMATLGVLTQQEARDAIQWDLFIVVASAFGVSSAMTNSGVAKGLAQFLVRVGNGLNIGGTFQCVVVRP